MPEGILIVWTDIPPEIEADFNDWYNHEHLPDRIGRMPGFLHGRRYVLLNAAAGAPKYLTFYDLQNTAAMLSDAHTALRQHRTDRDKFFVPRFRNTIKGICDVACRCVGDAVDDSGYLVLLPVTAGADRDTRFTPAVCNALLPQVAAISGVTSAVYAPCNDEMTRASSAKDDRLGDRYVRGLIAVETATEAAATAVAQALSEQRLARAGGALQWFAAPAVLRRIADLRA